MASLPTSGRKLLGTQSVADTTYIGAEDLLLGDGGLAAGDFDGDGIVDLVIGTFPIGVTTLVSQADFVPGPIALMGQLDEAEWTKTTYVAGYDARLEPMAPRAKDIDGDGKPELELHCASCLVDGSVQGVFLYLDLSSASGTLDVVDAQTLFTLKASGVPNVIYTGAPVDQDGDGTLDLWVGHSTGQWVTLVPGPLEGTKQEYQDAVARYEGDGSAISAGKHVDNGDFDGDGIPDLVTGRGDATSANRTRVYVVTNPPIADALIDDVASTVFTSGWPDEYLGNAQAAVPDLNGDGYDEVAFSRGEAFWTTIGGTYLWYGPPPTGSVPAVCAPTLIDFRDDLAVIQYGDFDGDGTTDLLGGGPVDGNYWLYYGPVATGYHDPIVDADAWFDPGNNWYAWAISDVDGDGSDEVALTNVADSTGGYGAGAVRLLFGGML